jgi:hypothetical protein
VADEKGNPVQVEYAELKKRANGSDPFSVPDGAKLDANQDLKNLYAARFMAGFKARIGLPPGLHPREVPDVVTLGANTAAVSFTLMCAEFIVVQLTPQSGYTPASWLNKSQPPNQPWLFNTQVDLRLGPADKSEYDKLPPDVQEQIKKLDENAFSVRQLLFVLKNAGLEPIPTITGVDPSSTLYLVLEKFFINEYFLNLKKNGQPVLGAAILPKQASAAALVPTDLNYEVLPLLGTDGKPLKNPTKDQAGLTTLNYLLATDGHRLPDPHPFTWNWLDQSSEQAEYHGVMALKSGTFWNHLLDDLKTYARQFCLLPYAKIAWNGKFYGVQWSLDVDGNPELPENSRPGAPYSFKYQKLAEDSDWNIHGGSDRMYLTIQTTYEFSLNFDIRSKTISIHQHLTVYVYDGDKAARHLGNYLFDGNVIDRIIDTDYQLTVDEHGQIVAQVKSNKVDEGTAVVPDRRFNAAFNIANQIAQKAQAFAYSYQPPTAAVQKMMFPGGKSFAFKKVDFSDHLDLVAHVTYEDPR